MEILRYLPDHITRIITDSRRATQHDIDSGNTAFVAIRTNVADGHKYVEQLYERGLRTFIVESSKRFQNLDDAVFIETEGNTLDFLINAVGTRLRNSKVKQIVVTGSRKKTTVKELLAATMSHHGASVARSPRTWNSAMGIALSILDNLSRDTEYIITEVGIDAPQQAKRIRPMLRPEIGVITHITDEHDECFEEGHIAKIAEKVAIVRDAKKIVYLDTDEMLKACIESLHHPNVVGVKSIPELIKEITGYECCDLDVSTRTEVRKIPDDGILFLDSFTNDLESLPLSLDLAAQRQAGRGLSVFLGDFKGDRNIAKQLIEGRGGKTFFYDNADTTFINSLNRSSFAQQLILIKGKFEPLSTFFDEARHDTTLEVNLEALVHNLNIYRSMLPPETGIIGMVKADAYGVGSLEVSKTLQAFGASYLAVAVIDEGIALRKAGIKMPIIVINPITNRYDSLKQYNLEPAIFSFDELEHICKAATQSDATPLPIHIKLDTGMHRIGFIESETDRLIQILQKSPAVKTASIFSHLATADCTDLKDYTDKQVQLFERMSSHIIERLGSGIKRHLLNTAGITTLGKTASAYDMARLGIGLYGISPVEGTENKLRPVASLISTVISLKFWAKGTPIGYGCKGITKRDSYIATLPIGYADGISRHLGNGNAKFLVEGIACPTIGNICMDQLMIDVTDAVLADKNIKLGTKVEIFGTTESIVKLAETLNTIPYEILTSISPRVRRTYISH